MTGAILRHEFLVPARKLRTFLVRGGYALVLAALFGIIYLYHLLESAFFGAFGLGAVGLPAQSVSVLAQRFANWLVNINITACLVFTPMYVAGAIAQEKDRRTIQDLLLTLMRDTEIVLSKLLARLAHVAFALLTSLPLFAIAALLGGVDGSMMIALTAMTLLWLLFAGAFTLLMSVVVRRTRDAILGTYALGTILLVGVFLARWFFPSWPWLAWLPPEILGAFNPYFVLEPAWSGAGPAAVWTRIAVTTAVLGGFSAVLIGLTICLLRPLGVRQLEVTASRRWGRRDRASRSPTERPMLWKEKYFPPSGRITRLMRRLGVVAVMAMLGLLGWLYYQATTAGLGPYDVLGWMQWPRLLAWPLYLSLLLTTSSAFSGERERATWDALLTSPLAAREIVTGKLWGSIWEVRWWLLVIVLATAQAMGVALCTPTTPWMLGGPPPTTTVTTTTTNADGTVTVSTTATTVATSGRPVASTAWPRLKNALTVLTGSLIGFTPGTVGILSEILFITGLGLYTSLVCRSTGKSMAIALAIWLASGWVVSIVAYMIGVAVFLALAFEWGQRTPPAWLEWLGETLAQNADWLVPTLSGLFWSVVGLWLIRSTIRRFDELGSRMAGGSEQAPSAAAATVSTAQTG